MKKRTSSMSRRIVSLLMSMVLTLTLVTPAAFATEVVDGSGTAIIEGNTNPADAAPSGDAEGGDSEDEEIIADDEEDADGDDSYDVQEDTLLGISLYAADARDGTVDTDWYTNAADGTGTADKPYEISTAEQLAGLAQLVNSGTETFPDKIIKLTADIDLGGKTWTPIGNSIKANFAFKGGFYGQGHIISNLYVPDTYCPGLFGNVKNTNSLIQDLVVTGTVMASEIAGDNGDLSVGGVCCETSGVIQNCGFYGKIAADEYFIDDVDGYRGGVVGDGKAVNCWFYSTDAGSDAGVTGNRTATNCYHNVQGNYQGTYVAENFVSTAVEKLNAALKENDIPWKDSGAGYPQFLAENERLLTLKPLLSTSAAKVLLDGEAFQTGIVVEKTVKLTGAGLSYRLGETGDWTKIGAEGAEVSLKDAGRIVTIYYASDDDFNASKWYEEHKTETTFTIKNASELAYLAQLVNTQTESFSGKTVVLGNDIDLCHKADEANGIAAANWTPIGTFNSYNDNKPFDGTFDGKGHTISSLYIQTNNAHQGLFGYLSGSVRNLIVTGTVDGGSANNVAGIAGSVSYDAKIENCGFYGSVISTSAYFAGGVVGGGGNSNTVTGCWYYYTGDQNDGSYALGVCGGTPGGYCYHNVNNNTVKTRGNYIPNDGFAAGVAVNLNVFAFQNSTSEKELCLWRSEDGTAHPVFDTAADRSKLTVVGLAKSVERSTVEGQAALRVNGAQVQSCLAEKGTALTLTLAEGYTGDAIYFTDEDASVRKLEDLKEIKADGTTTYTVPVGAGEAVTLYYGTYDEFGAQEGVNAWYYNNNNKDGSFFIQTEAELRFMAKLVNENGVDFKGCTITLQKDITLHGDWTPIGNTGAKPFRGTFHGAEIIKGWPNDTFKPWVISGLRVTGDDPYAGLFGVVENGTIRYMNLKDGTVTGSDSVGSIVGWMKSGTLEECTSTVVVSGSENAAVGTLVGKNGGTVSKSYYYNMSCTAPLVGSGTTKNCYYLAATSSFGKENDDGARTETEFQYGRVTYDMGGQLWKVKSGAAYNEKQPRLDGADHVRLLQVAKRCEAQPEALLSLSGDGVLENDGVYYYYGKDKEVRTATVTGQTGMVLFTPSLRKDSDGSYTLSVGRKYTWTVVDADTSWYENNTEKTYAFKNAAELKGFALLSNGKVGATETFAGWKLSLAADEIDLSGYEWEPIGNSGTSREFAGEFDGKNKLIKGMTITTYAQRVGLFGMVAGSVHNVQVEGSIDVTGTGTIYAGGIVAVVRSNANVTNCLNRVNVKVTNNANSMTYVGGVVGSGKVTLCWNEGTVQGTGRSPNNVCVGGICGGGSATDCANFGTVEGCGKYTGGILGNGTVANSYDNGTVSATGGAVARGINGSEADKAAATTNSYYASRLNGEDVKLAYVSKGETAVTYNAENKTYTVGEDAALLVDKLNENCDGNTPWFVNQDEGVYLPIHVLKWTGDQDERFIGKIITITYYPNDGVNKDGVDDSISVPVTLMPNLSTGGFEAVQYTILAANDETLGFKHENGTIKATPWNTDATGNGRSYAAGSTIQVSKDITLYAQWNKIWEGKGTEDSPYQISDAEKLTALQTQVNDEGFNYKGKYFALTPENKTIALTGKWTPIGNGNTSFGGSIEGNGTTITGLQVSEEWYAGLFRLLGVDGTSTYIRNLTISGDVTAEKSHAGGLTAIVGNGTITLENITTEVTVTSHGDANYALPFGSAGGLIGYNVANNGAAYNVVKVINCTNKGNISGATAGGIAGANNDPNAASQYTLEDCTNKGSVTGLLYAGGILGGSTNSTATRCENSGTVKATGTTGTRGYAGGICATNLRWAKRCVNTGEVCGQYAGGIAYGLSSTYGGEAKYCLNKGNITGTRIAAGIVAYGKSEDISGIGGISFSYNLGKVTADAGKGAAERAYGIASSGNIKNCFTYNEAKHVAISASNELVTNSYYLADSAGEFSTAQGGEWASKADFASGKVAWGVDGGTGAHASYWTQGANNYPVPIGEGTSTSYYRAKAECGTGGAVSIKSSRNFTGDADNAVYGPKGMSVTVTATPKDDTFGLKSLTLDLMGTGSATALESGDSFTLGEANALVVATFASTGNGGSGGGTGGNGGDGDGTGTDTGDGAGDENDEGLQDGLNMDVEYNIKGLVLAAYAEWGANGGGKTFAQWLKASPSVLRAFITNSLDNMAAAAKSKDTDEAKGLAALLLASLNEHSGLDGQSSDTIAKMLRKYIESGTEAAFSAWLTTGGGMASGTYESIFAQYTNSLLALADRLYTNWESSGTSLTFPQWLDAQQVSMESLSENANEPDTDTDDTQTSEAPEEVPDGQESEGGASGGGNSVWEVIGTVVRENPIIVWAIVAVVAALIIVGAVRRYRKVKRDEHDDVTSKK